MQIARRSTRILGIGMRLFAGSPALVGCGGPLEPPAPKAPPASETATAPTVLPQFTAGVPKNILMIPLDTMRRDRMGRYSTGPSLTPFLDQLATEGFTVDDLAACSNWTMASTSCVESGAGLLDRAPERGMIPIVTDGILAPIPSPEPMLSDWLRDGSGFSSLLVTTNGFYSAQHGNAQGYDRTLYRGPNTVEEAWGLARRLLVPADGGTPMAEPWFLHLHFFEPHRPYLPPETYLDALAALPPIPFDLATEKGQDDATAAIAAHDVTDEVAATIEQAMTIRYEGEVRFFDDELRAMWAELDSLGFLDDALVVFWTDHGEELWDHGVAEHGKLLHAQENAAILWFWSRDIVPGSWGGPVIATDIAPTLLALYGLPIPPTVTGIPLGLAPADRLRFALTDAYIGPVASVRRDRTKLEFRWGGQPVGVYDTLDDPLETTSIFDASDPRTLALWAQLAPAIRDAAPFVAQDPRGWNLVWPTDLPPAPAPDPSARSR